MASQHCEDFLYHCMQMTEEQLEQLKSFAMNVD